MAERTIFLDELCRCWHGCVFVLLLAFAATACSGGSSGNDESGDSRDTVAQSRSQRNAVPQPVTQRRAAAPRAASGINNGPRNRDDRADDNAQDDGANSATGEALNLDTLILRLDRLVSDADAYMLRTGVTADAMSSALSLGMLEERLRSTQAQLRAARPAPPADVFVREERE